MNKILERTEVLEPCMKLCKRLKLMGYILKWRRLDALDCYHEPGDPDIEIWVSCAGILTIIMCECKYGDGKLRKSQIECKEKYSKYKNVIYRDIYSVYVLKELIINMADNINFNPEIFNDFNNTKDL